MKKNRNQFQHFGDFDHTHIGGSSKLEQWQGKVKKRYNAFVYHANRVILLHQPDSQSSSQSATIQAELLCAVEEVKHLAQLRLYELQCIDDKFEANCDGPGTADFICYNACEFFDAVYTARTEIVIWRCLTTRFTGILEPHDVIKSMASVLSNRVSDEQPWYSFCTIVEEELRNDNVAEALLGVDAHSQFLRWNNERLYTFQRNWIPEIDSGEIDLCAPIYADSPDYGYHRSFKYRLDQKAMQTRLSKLERTEP